MTDGHLFEYECAKKLKHNGFTKVTVTKGSGDQGIDIIAYGNGKKYAIQCKYYTSPVGNAAVQEAYAGAKYYNCDKAVVMTNTSFTQSAIELSKATGVLLWPYGTIKIQFPKRPIYLHALKILGIFNIVIGILTFMTIFVLNIEIKYRLLQGIESIIIIFCGVFTLLQVKNYVIGVITTSSFAILAILSAIIDILCIGKITMDALIFLFFSVYSFLCNIIEQHSAKKKFF